MDVNKLLLEGEWLEVEVESKKINEPFRFKLRPISSTEQLKMLERVQKNDKLIVNEIASLILDWNLEFDGKKLACDPANKEKYLEWLLLLVVKKKQDEEEDSEEEKKKRIKTIGVVILEFAQNIENFIKN